MVVIPGPVEFLMGLPLTEVGRHDLERQHMKRIGRTFALAAKSVTAEQYFRFEHNFAMPLAFGWDPALPVVGLDWFRGAKYCNWLSEQEGIPEEEWCYDIRGDTVRLKANYLSLSGYRLPTEAEMEYATRAGALTARYFGETEELLGKYAWYNKSAQDKLWPVGSLKPNDWGFFDVLGNCYTWCQERHKLYPQEKGVIEDKEDILLVTSGVARVLRGQGFSDPGAEVRSAHRTSAVPTTLWSSTVGIRPSRTLPLGSVTALRPTPKGPKKEKRQADWAAELKIQVETQTPTGIVMVLIPPDDVELLKPYLLGKYEVTQAEWETVMGYNPSSYQKKWRKEVAGLDTSRFPVENVSWFDCVEFCNKLSVKEGLKPYYELEVLKRRGKTIEDAVVKLVGGNGYHVPTDAEWEHGCQAGTKTRYHFGDRAEYLGYYAWYDRNGGNRTHEVGQKRPNAFGLYDMHGNVREWNEELQTDANTGAPELVHRGGSVSLPADFCEVSNRSRTGPDNHYRTVGLRLARVP